MHTAKIVMYKSEVNREGFIFHELAHEVFSVENDFEFNEAFAHVEE